MRVAGSLCYSLMQDIKEELKVKHRGKADSIWNNFATKRCLGVLTKVDKHLESNSQKSVEEYNRDFAIENGTSL